MYTLRGPDGTEHGPLSSREVRDWIADGRANGGTAARAADETEWRPLSQFIEFGPALAASAPPADSIPEETRPKTYLLLGFSSLVMSLLGICFLPGILLGIATLILAKLKPRQVGGRRLAIAAIIIGLLWPITVGTIGYTKFRSAMRDHYRGVDCPAHVRSLVNSLQVVAYANKGTYPTADTWCDAISKEVTSKTHFQCPEDPAHATCAYGYNARLSGAKNPDKNTVAVFESNVGWNGSGGPAEVITTPRHSWGGVPFVQPSRSFIWVGFVGGGVRPVSTNEIGKLRWDP